MQQELATQTEDTDSKENGPDIYDEEEDCNEELDYQEPNEYKDEQLHQNAENKYGNHARDQSGAKEKN